MRAVTYARVSSQVQKDRHTIDSQLRVLPEFVARHGWTLVAPTTTYVDDGKTAKAGHLEKRAGFQRLLRDMTAGKFDVVVVIDQDRLTRSEDLRERGEILGAFQRAGVKIAIASTGQLLDLTSSMGDLMSGLQAFFSAEENRKRRERTVRGKIEAAMKGRKPAGPTLYGYRYDRSTGEWSIDEGEAAIVRELYRRTAAGDSCYALSQEMNVRKVRRARGGAWQRDRVWKIVTNPAYRGEYVAHKERQLVVKVPAIVSDETWAATQRGLALRRTVPRPAAKHVNLCQGIAVCAMCGDRMRITGNSKGTRYYVCRSKLTSGWRTCPGRMFRVETTDDRVWGEVVRFLRDRRWLASTARYGQTQTPQSRQELATIEGKLAHLERAQGDILTAYQQGSIPESVFRRALANYETASKVLRTELDLARGRASAAAEDVIELQDLRRTIKRLRERIERTTPRERQEIMRRLVAADGASIRLGDTIEIVGSFEGLADAAVSSYTAERKTRVFRLVTRAK